MQRGRGQGEGGLLGACLLLAVTAATRTEAGTVQLEDVSVPAGVHFKHDPKNASVPGLLEFMPSGVAVGDFNRDGWPDLFVCGGGDELDRLFINGGDGTFTNQAAAWGIAAVHAGIGASVADFNNDGWLDIYVTSYGNGVDNKGQHGKNILYRNSGRETFTNVAESAGVHLVSEAPKSVSAFGSHWGDYDLDGDLDLYVASWVASAQASKLFRNNGDETFTNVTLEAGLFEVDMHGFQGCFADMNEDGYPELLVAADFHSSRYYANNGDGTFTNITVPAGLGIDENGMGQTVGDLNNDGRLDWYVTSIYLDRPTPTSGRGNTLYMNVGDNQYLEIAEEAGVVDGGWGWGTIAADLDHDGWQDLVEVNGRQGGLDFQFEQEYVWQNNGNWTNILDGTFAQIAPECGVTTKAEGRSSSWLDYDRDGDVDVAIGLNQDFFTLYRNMSMSGGWLHVTLNTSANPLLAPDGFGARLTATVGAAKFVRYIDGGPNFLGTSEIAAHFGLGDAAVIDSLEILWPRGAKSTLLNVAANQHLVVQAPVPADFDGNGVVDGADLGLLLASWGEVTSGLALYADLNNDHVVDGGDLGLLLGAWTP